MLRSSSSSTRREKSSSSSPKRGKLLKVLKSLGRPKTSPISATAYPHIIDTILDHVYHSSPVHYHGLQAICKAWRNKIKTRLFAHVRFSKTDAGSGCVRVTTVPPSVHLSLTHTALFSTFLPWTTVIDFHCGIATKTLHTLPAAASKLQMVRFTEPVEGRRKICPFAPPVTVVSHPTGLINTEAPDDDVDRRHSRQRDLAVIVFRDRNWGFMGLGHFVMVLDQYYPKPRCLVIMCFPGPNRQDIASLISECIVDTSLSISELDCRVTIVAPLGNTEAVDIKRKAVYLRSTIRKDEPYPIQYMFNRWIEAEVDIMTHAQYHHALGADTYRLHALL